MTRNKAAQVIAKHFGTTAHHAGGGYDEYHVNDSQGRKWKIVSDASIRPQNTGGRSASDLYKVEMVSPICVYDDIPIIQEIVRKLRDAGAVTNKSCGIHIHVNAAPHNAKTLWNITNIIAAKEDMIYKALQVDVARERYCKKTNMRFLEELNQKKPKTIQEVNSIWYQNNTDSRGLRQNAHYHDSRYHCLNLHSVFTKGTIEFRLFNGTTHAGKIKAYIQFCLAISHQALSQTSASRQKTVSTNEKYTFRVWLLRLGMIGDEFKTAREHLLEHLDGCIAWKDPAQAERQKERLRKKREQEQAAAEQSADDPQMEQTEENNENMGLAGDDEGPGFSMSM